MADAHLRGLQRGSADGDPEMEERLGRERCRAGQCCAHATFPPVPDNAASVVTRFRTFGLIPGHMASHEGRIEFHGDPDKIAEVFRWLRACGVEPPRPTIDEQVPEPDGDFSVVEYTLRATPMEGSIRPTTEGSASCATNAFEYAPAPVTVSLSEGLWRCELRVRGGGMPGMVRLAYRGHQSRDHYISDHPPWRVVDWTVRVPPGSRGPLRMDFRRATSAEVAIEEP